MNTKCVIWLTVLVALAAAQDSNDTININPSGCGRRPIQGGNRIVGGQEAIPGDWGWQIALLDYGTFICGGSLINSQWVLTAAHCVAGNTSPHGYKVLIGAHNRESPEDGSLKKQVVKVIAHEKYSTFPSIFNDVALLKLDTPVEYTDRIVPVCINDGSLDYEGASAVATGFGALRQHGLPSVTKQEVALKIFPERYCSRYGLGYDHEIGVCAGGEAAGKDACKGDSGGPLVVQNVNDAKWYIYGVTSWGNGCGSPGFPGIYARTSAFYNWIVEKVKFN